MPHALTITIFGLSITSSWGNGHATTYRGLVRELAARGHTIWFFERDVPWYRETRDLAAPPGAITRLYPNLETLEATARQIVAGSDVVVIGSYVPDGKALAEWVLSAARGLVAFYDIDTPVTLGALERDACEYLSPDLIPRFDLYLSFTGGPTLTRLEQEWGAKRARPLYCSVDLAQYFPERAERRWDLGYLGTYSVDRQTALDRLLLEPAGLRPDGRFVVAGSQYPDALVWPRNVERIVHVAPADHRAFYNAQAFTLNVTRAEMRGAGYSPSVRLFEAAACGVPIVSDAWPGLETFFEPGVEILVARDPADVLATLDLDEGTRRRIAARARERVLREHTAAHRAAELERYCHEASEATAGIAVGSRHG